MIRLDFAISGIQASPVLLALIGFVVGVLGGFFGVGGGFLAGPLMFAMGVPGNFVVGTDLAHLVGKSIVAAKFCLNVIDRAGSPNLQENRPRRVVLWI